MGNRVVLRLVVAVLWWGAACGQEPDEMLSALEAGGATRAAVCGAGGGGCRAALWSSSWLLARASCLDCEVPAVKGALVLLHRDPEDCSYFYDKPRCNGSLEALASVPSPAYWRRASDEEWAPPPARGPQDAALVLLARPAPPPPPCANHSATLALLPELSWWLRVVPLSVPWVRDSPPPPRPAHYLDPARHPWLDSPMRVLALTAILPPALLLAVFALVMNWPLRSSTTSSTEAKEVLIDFDSDMQHDTQV